MRKTGRGGWMFLWCRARGTGRRAQSTGRRAQGTGHRARGAGHRARGAEHRAQGTGTGLAGLAGRASLAGLLQ